MLRMFYYNHDDFVQKSVDRKILRYGEGFFEELLNWQYDEDGNSIMPFRDEFSKKFLKNTWNIEFVRDDDWYSIQSPEEGRFCLSGLSREMKYALTLLHFSRKNIVLSYEFCGKNIWKVLSEMPFDILVAVDTTELKSWEDVCLGINYIIENFPFNGEYIQVQVSDYLIKDKQKVDITDEVLLYIEDGKYYACALELHNYLTHYDWKKHVETIIKYAGYYVKDEHPIVNKTLVCNVKEYAKLLGLKENYFLDCSEYGRELYSYKRMLQEGDITQEEFNEVLPYIKRRYATSYKDYLWLKGELKICSHLYKLPTNRTFRKLPMMIVDKFPDGSYKIWGTLTVKYPKFEEILYNVLTDLYTEECERYIIVVNVEEVFNCAEDIKYTDCGFKITKNCIEIFDENDTLKMFIDIAQEAISSDKCEISTEFY